jgi:hypothetical protein
LDKKIFSYIALWGWQILGIMFFISSFVLIALPRTTQSIVFAIAFFFIFAICEYKSLERKKEFYDGQDLS